MFTTSLNYLFCIEDSNVDGDDDENEFNVQCEYEFDDESKASDILN